MPDFSGYPVGQLLKPEGVARILDVNIETLRHWRHRNKGPKFSKLDGFFIRYAIPDLQEWLTRCAAR